MKKSLSSLKKQAMAALILLLLFCACYEFDFVNQPGSAEPDHAYTVNISITTNDGYGGESYTPYFGIKLPEGWILKESLTFTCDTFSGVFLFSDSLVQAMYEIDPPDTGYYWWVGAGTEPVIYDYGQTYLINPVIHTDNQTGTFYLDYMAGSNSYDLGGLNWERSDNHTITVGLPDQVVVTSTNDSGPGSLREAIENIDFYGTITFDLSSGNTINLEDQLNIEKDIHIIGPEIDPMIISGSNAHQVFYIGQYRTPHMKNLVITEGLAYQGGGIYCSYESEPVFDNLTLSNNNAEGNGGGLYLDNSSPVINGMIIEHNDAGYAGGGIYCQENSSPELTNIFINNNSANYGGGMYCGYYSGPQMNHLSITDNTAEYGGGMYCEWDANPAFHNMNRCNINLNNALYGTDLYSEETIHVVVDTFTVMIPTEFHAYPIENFTFDILNGKIEQVNADLYVSPVGSNTNSGLTPGEPLKTIRVAFLKMLVDQLNPHTVHLQKGTYSPSTNGESFPVIMREYINLTGGEEMDVVLNAENESNVLILDDNSTSHIKNMTITGGLDDNGGGIFCNYSNPVLENLIISNNKATDKGGGIYLDNSSSPELINVNIINNTAYDYGGGIYSDYGCAPVFDDFDRCNIYLNNAGRGNDLYAEQNMNVIVDTFTVLTPSEYHAYPLGNFEFDILHGKVEQVNADLYVSPDGDNNNSGLTADEPLKNINFAYSKLLTDSSNVVTIHLLEGTYSPSTNNEVFPLLMLDYVNLSGTSVNDVILDAEQIAPVIEIYDNEESNVSNLTISGGDGYNGGGIYCSNSSPNFEHLSISNNLASSGGGIYCDNSSHPGMLDILISNNTAESYGGGIFCDDNSSPVLENVQMINNTSNRGGAMFLDNSASPIMHNVSITNNTASGGGGGIFCDDDSSPSLQSVSIHDNTANYGGGMYFDYYTNPIFDTLNRCNIYMNTAETGGDLYSDRSIDIIVDTFTVMYPKFYHAYPLSNFNFDILYGLIPQVAADLYVSPEGDNNNSGLTADDPFKTIEYALVKIAEDSLNIYTIHLLEGIYSPSTNGEVFPLMMVEYVKLSGTSPEEVFLDAEETSNVIGINDIIDTRISNLTIRGGKASYGGGIHCSNSDPVLDNLIITDNESYDYGGGICCTYNSNPHLKNITISNNSAQYSGGGIYCYDNSGPILENLWLINNSSENGGGIYAGDGSPSLEDVIISGNEASYSGGGLYCEYNALVTLKHVSIINNAANYGGGIYSSYNSGILFDSVKRSNIYHNSALNGKDIYSDIFIEVVVDTFSVLYPTEFFVCPLENFSFDILNGKIEQVDADLYVSPEGDDANGGLTADDPLKTIYYAFSKIMADSIHQHTIYLLEGTYGPSANGDIFPVNMLDYVSISGTSQHQVILHGEDQYGIMMFDNNVGSIVSNLTLTHGNSGNGGGIFCANSSPALLNLTLMKNYASGYGGGIHCADYSSPEMTNITIAKNGAGRGGGLACTDYSNPVVQDSRLMTNQASYRGGGIYCDDYSDPTLLENFITSNTADQGGGAYCEDGSQPVFQNVKMSNNKANMGGGIFCEDNSDIVLIGTDIFNNTAESRGGGLYCDDNSNPEFNTMNRSNIYLNKAARGRDLYSQVMIQVVVDTFSVLFPTKIYAEPLDKFEFDILHGILEQVDADLYVSPMGDNDNSGLSAEEPLKTIYFAFSKILVNITHPHTIHLLEGTYSPSNNGEQFPIYVLDYITLSGTSADAVILNAEGESGVLEIFSTQGTSITNLSITGGNNYNGGGIYCEDSNPFLTDLVILSNTAESSGGGIYCDDHASPILYNVHIQENTANRGGGLSFSDYSNPDLETVFIHNNTATDDGGGLHCNYHSNPVMLNVIIENNTANNSGGGLFLDNGSDPEIENGVIRSNSASHGGGIYCYDDSDPGFSQVSITNNVASYMGGGIYCEYNSVPEFDTLYRSSIYLNYAESGNELYSSDFMEVVLDTFTVMLPKNHQASPLTNFTFDLLHGLYPQVEMQLFVSPSGNDANSGQSPNAPLKTIQYAFSKIEEDSLNFYDVHLMNGTYSPSTNGEIYPILLDDYASLTGSSENNVILDAEETSHVIEIHSKRAVEITHLTLTGGSSSYGGGLYISDSDPVIENLNIHDNTASKGGGIYCYNSSPAMNQVEISNNIATSYGGGIYTDESSDVSFEHMAFNNNAAEYGGGLYISDSESILSQLAFTSNTAEYKGGALFCNDHSSLHLENVSLSNNSAVYNGGGVFCDNYSDINLKNTSITNNSSGQNGGGVFCNYNSTILFDSVDRSNIYLNLALTGRDLYSESMMTVVVDTFTVLYPKNHHAFPLSNFTFDILNGMLPQVHADLYVSPEGDDGNSGLTPEDPLKTINYAMEIIAEDSLNFYTVNLLEGTYSPSATGEVFPIYMVDYIILSGTSADEVTLDGEGLSNIIVFNEIIEAEIANLTITGGDGSYGGGIYCYKSNPVIHHININNNTSSYGGGIYLNNYSSPVINNITLSNNSAWQGGGLSCDNHSSPLISDIRIENNTANEGGGIYCYQYSDPIIQDGQLTNNEADYRGGGIYCDYNAVPYLENTRIVNNSSENEGGGIWCNSNSNPIFDTINKNSIYLNSAQVGNDLYSDNFMEVVVDTFTVMYPKNYHAFPRTNFTFDIQAGLIPQVCTDLFVSPEGNNTNSGLNADEPLKTLEFAFSMIAQDSLNLYTVNLLDGVYSPSATGEIFPVYMMDYVILTGSSSEDVILDGEGLSGVIELHNIVDSEISHLTITGGNGDSYGGGIYCTNSKPIVQHIRIYNNYADYGGGIYFDENASANLEDVQVFNNSAEYGGGIYCDDNSSPVIKEANIRENSASYGGGIYCRDDSGPWLESVQLIQNEASSSGGGLYCKHYSFPVLKNVRIAHNSSSGEGGGIYCSSSSKPLFDSINRSNIYLNNAAFGNDLYSDNFFHVIVDTFTVLFPKNYHSFPRTNFSFDILYGLLPQVSADLYVSPEGDNANSGLNAEEPLKTINFALSIIAEDSLNMYTIHLANGTYSPSVNEEFFPLYIPDYIRLEGGSESDVFLDAEQMGTVLMISYSHQVELNNMTIMGGSNSDGFGGGIYMEFSSGEMSNITLTGNSAQYGGGIFLDNSSPSLTNVTITGNVSLNGGAGLCCRDESSPVLYQVTITENQASTYGGGMYCTHSSPVLSYVTIDGNSASTGAGMYTVNNSDPVMEYVVVINNIAVHSGGGIYGPYCSPSIKNSTISFNTSTSKGGVGCS